MPLEDATSAEGQWSGGAEEQGSWGAEEQGGKGAEEQGGTSVVGVGVLSAYSKGMNARAIRIAVPTAFARMQSVSFIVCSLGRLSFAVSACVW